MSDPSSPSRPAGTGLGSRSGSRTGSRSGSRSGARMIKICGVTRPEDAALAAELGADLLGLNFYPPSPRSLDPEQDRARLAEIADAAAGVPTVGVFVDEDPERIEEIEERVGLALVQLHGDESPETVRRFGRRAVRVFRRDRLPAPEELALYPEVWGFLFDLPVAPVAPERGARQALYGGTGEAWDYEMLAALEDDRPVLVAGGIRPETARAALAASHAAGVDVCSGIESSPGCKDPELMKRLFEEVRHDTT